MSGPGEDLGGILGKGLPEKPSVVSHHETRASRRVGQLDDAPDQGCHPIEGEGFAEDAPKPAGPETDRLEPCPSSPSG